MNRTLFRSTVSIAILLTVALVLALYGVTMHSDLLNRTKPDVVKYAFVMGIADEFPLPEFSLSIQTSDLSFNEKALNAVIGTLVKYNSSGKISPYLADRFDVSQEGKLWKFHLRSGLTCQDGTPITASAFVEHLQSQLRNYSTYSRVIDFDLLVGWQEFASGNDVELKGLSAVNDEIIFQFVHAPVDLLELLRMPYFGFWKNLSYQDKQGFENFVSSGAYEVDSASAPSKLVFKKRQQWFNYDSTAPRVLELSYERLNKMSEASYQSQFQVIEVPGTYDQFPIGNGLAEIITPPNIVATIVLSPFTEGPLKDIDFRRSVRSELKEEISKSSLFKFNTFFVSARSVVEEVPVKPLREFSNFKGKSVRFAFNSRINSEETVSELERIVSKVFALVGVHVEYLFDNPNPEWIKKLHSNNTFDMRLASVANGAFPKNNIIKMMFCTTMGISFPDPKHRVCDLVSRTDSAHAKVDQNYIEQFNQILAEEAVVVPFRHYGLRWLYSKKMNPHKFPPTVVAPLFEELDYL